MADIRRFCRKLAAADRDGINRRISPAFPRRPFQLTPKQPKDEDEQPDFRRYVQQWEFGAGRGREDNTIRSLRYCSIEGDPLLALEGEEEGESRQFSSTSSFTPRSAEANLAHGHARYAGVLRTQRSTPPHHACSPVNATHTHARTFPHRQ